MNEEVLTIDKLIKMLQDFDGDIEVGVDVGDGFFMRISKVVRVDEEDFYGEPHQNAVLIEIED